DPLGGRIRPDVFWMVAFDGLQFGHQAVVLRIRDGRRVFDVIAAVVALDFRAQGFQALPVGGFAAGAGRVRIGTSGHENTRAARSVPARKPAWSSWSYSALICRSMAGEELSWKVRPWSSSTWASRRAARSRPTVTMRLKAWSSGRLLGTSRTRSTRCAGSPSAASICRAK